MDLYNHWGPEVIDLGGLGDQRSPEIIDLGSLDDHRSPEVIYLGSLDDQCHTRMQRTCNSGALDQLVAGQRSCRCRGSSGSVGDSGRTAGSNQSTWFGLQEDQV